MIRKTSKNAYEHNKRSGISGSQKRELYDLVDKMTKGRSGYGVTLKELSRESGLEINAVSGRINDLKKEGMIAECSKRKCSITNRTVVPVTIGDGDVGGTTYANLNDKNHLEEQSELDLGNTTRYEYPD